MGGRYLRESQAKVRHLRNKLWYEQAGLCGYCSEWVAKADATFDHIIPHKYGGPVTWGNGLMTCEPCNVLKCSDIPYDISRGWVPSKALVKKNKTRRINAFLRWLDNNHTPVRTLL